MKNKLTLLFMDKFKVFLLSVFAVLVSIVHAQENVLDNYIYQGLESNILVQQRDLTLENALYSLKQAKRLYVPTLDFQAGYTTATGGRDINLPVGDLMNPVYSTLNQFMGQEAFPLIENQQINFLPHNYYDARVRLSVPILNMDIIHNKNIVKKQYYIKENELQIYKRELVKEIKLAYYNYLSAIKVIEIQQNTLELAEVGKRKNEKLIEAGSGLHAYVLRSETEIAQVQSKLVSAQQQLLTLKHYFNALLNRGADEEIIVDTTQNVIPFVEQKINSIENREELQSLEQGIALREDMLKLNKQIFVPKVNGFADLGSQAENFKFNDQSRYYMIGLQLNIPIFAGGKK